MLLFLICAILYLVIGSIIAGLEKKHKFLGINNIWQNAPYIVIFWGLITPIFLVVLPFMYIYDWVGGGQ